uniref:Major facilitator superfamily (MFS) profile domain-containing protein n=1 Tax=Hyaloperonospora arabidopsidis (strain Emoy2) TaxID=559515 RepID=M4BW83_HYAAE
MSAPADTVEAVQRITQRIDAIGERDPGVFMGLSWYYIRLILLTGFGWAMDSMETFIFTYCAELIRKDIPQSAQQASFLGGAVFVGSFIGSFPFGSLADKYGRRPIFMVTLVLFLAGLAFCALSWNVTSITCARIISGIGLGGELPVASTLVQELSPKKTRGKIIVLLESFWAVGCMMAVVMAFAAAPEIGWRETFYICCAPVVYAIVIRYCIPESPKWLASVGRYDEAVAIVEAIERAHGLDPYDPKADVESIEAVSTTPIPPRLPDSHFKRIGMLFERQFRVRTIVLWTLWFGISMSYYAIFIYLPTLISLKGFDMNAHWETILIITAFQLPGYFAAAGLVEIIGRKHTLVIFLLGAFLSAIAMGYVDATKTPVMITGSFTSFFMLGAWGCVYAYTPENYPTAIRGMGAAYPSGFSRIGSFSGPYLCASMFGDWNMSLEGIMWVFGGLLMVVSAIVLFFGYEPRGKNVELYDEDCSVEKSSAFESVRTPN